MTLEGIHAELVYIIIHQHIYLLFQHNFITLNWNEHRMEICIFSDLKKGCKRIRSHLQLVTGIRSVICCRGRRHDLPQFAPAPKGNFAHFSIIISCLLKRTVSEALSWASYPLDCQVPQSAQFCVLNKGESQKTHFNFQITKKIKCLAD